MTAKQITDVRGKLVSLILSTSNPKEAARLVDTLINLEHGLVDLELKQKQVQQKTQIGLKHE